MADRCSGYFLGPSILPSTIFRASAKASSGVENGIVAASLSPLWETMKSCARGTFQHSLCVRFCYNIDSLLRCMEKAMTNFMKREANDDREPIDEVLKRFVHDLESSGLVKYAVGEDGEAEEIVLAFTQGCLLSRGA
jgi:hypothetical protein